VKILRWLAKNFGTLLTAFILAVIVWVSAVVASDPNEERTLNRPVPIELIGQASNLQIMGEVTQNATVILNAPASVWTQLNSDPSLITARVDLSNLGAGTHTVPVQIQITPHLVRLISQVPEQLTITLDSIASESLPVNLIVTGNPLIGYQAQTPQVNPTQVTISGPESLIASVKQVRVTMDITNINQTLIRDEVPVLLDAKGQVVTGLTVSPETVTVTQPITLLGGYRYLIVRAVTQGQVSSGYQVTNIFVSPVGVVVFSSDPELVNSLPGYVETQPLDITGKESDFDTLVDLNLPPGISVVGDTKVLVQISIEVIKSSLSISLPVELIGVSPGLEAISDPMVVDVILSGPVPTLNALGPTDVRVTVDLTGYEVGSHQLVPQVNILPDQVELVSLLPGTVQVTVTYAPTPTPVGTPNETGTPTQSPVLTPTP
jgi:YbbR domain-containing protein